jgi:uncharacterized damage-inducible protein DinB
MKTLLLLQYEMVKDSRQALLKYCASLLPIHFVEDITSFGRGSIRNLLIHTINTYKFWLKENAFNEIVIYQDVQDYHSIDNIIPLYSQVDILVENFLKVFKDKYHVPLTIPGDRGSEKTITPLMLFTHVITHEFHHKGQILSMSRHLGYIPHDTDIIR